MGTPQTNYTRIQYFSSPSVNFNGKYIGTTGWCNVARTIKESSYAVENFRSYTTSNGFSATINGPDIGNNNGTYTWSSYVTGGTASSYSWWYKIYGSEGGYRPLENNTQSLTMSLPRNSSISLKLTVLATSGEYDTDYHFVINEDDPSSPPLPKNTDVANTFNDTIPEILKFNNKQNNYNIQPSIEKNNAIAYIYPNPATTSVNIQCFSNNDNVTITIVNIDGSIIEKFTENAIPDSYYTKTINTEKYKNGVYFIKISTDEYQKTYKLIINH